MSRALPSSKKVHSEQHKAILKQLLRENGNKVCVDCKTSKNPRWASWNLGCFICIRCSGIHRSMGTHISKVKSVDLDAWTDEQIELMVKWGNDKCNEFWESKLPDGYIPNELKIENFIRTKYDMKKWAASSNVPDPMSVNVKPHNLHPSHTNQSNGSGQIASNQGADQINSFKTTGSTSKVTTKPKNPTTTADLLDDFGAFTSASSSPKVSPAPQTSTPQSAQSTGGSMGARPDLKKSILSLYSSPSSSQSFIRPQQTASPVLASGSANTSTYASNNSSNTFNAAGITSGNSTSSNIGRATPGSYNANNNLSNSLSGLNIGGTYAKKDPVPNNEWSDVTSNQWKPAPAPSLDDDLFKNVWS